MDSVNLTRTDGTVTASWDAPAGATKYHVTYTTDGGQSWYAPVEDNTNVTATSITITGADNAKTYIVGVQAGNEHGWSGWVNSPSIGPYTPKPTPTPTPTPEPTPAPAPSVTAARGEDAVSASVSWTAYTGDDFEYYRVIVCDDSQYDGSSCSGTVYKGDAIEDANSTGPVTVAGLDAGKGYGVILQTWRTGGALKSHATIAALPVTINLENVTATVATINVGNWSGQYYYQAENNSGGGGASGAGGASAAGSSGGNCDGSGNGGTGDISGLQPGADYTINIYSNSNCNGAAMASAQAQTEISSQQPNGAGECTYFHDRDGNDGQGDFGYSGDYTLTAWRGGYLRNYREDTYVRWVDPNNHASDQVDAACRSGGKWVRVKWAPDADGDGYANDPVTTTWKNRGTSNWICDRNTGIGPASSAPACTTHPNGGPPDDIASVNVVRSANNLYLYWTAPATVGNASITGYEASCSTNGGYDHSYSACGGNIGAAATSHTVTGVDSAKTYVVSMRALSSMGNSEWTESAFAAPLAAATLSASNLNKPDHTLDCEVSGDKACALAFTTGVAGVALSSVEAEFNVKSGSPGDIQVTLHADSNGVPKSAVLATLSGSNPDTAGNYIYTCAGDGCALSASTTYFIQFKAASGDDRNYYSWVTTLSDDQDLTPAGNGWSLADETDWNANGTWSVYNDSGKLKVSADTGARLDTSYVTQDTATLTVLNHPADWWYQRTAPTGDSTCHSIAAGVNTVSLTGLTVNTDHTYKAYYGAGCASADEIGSVTFKTLNVSLTADSVTATGVTLTLAGHTGNWHYQADATPFKSCSTAQSGGSVSLTDLSPGTSYTFKAYSDSACSAEIAAALPFNTLGVSVSNLNYANHNDPCNVSSATWCAVGFTTGSNGNGYTLGDVVALFGQAYRSPGDIQVTLHAASGGVIDSDALVTLSGSDPDTTGEYQYTCNGTGCALSPSTTYFIQFKGADVVGLGGYYKLRGTISDDQDTTPANNGWSLADDTRANINGSWQTYSDTSKVKVAATPVPTLTPSNPTTTGATLTLTGHTGDWYYKYTSPSGGACSSAVSGSSTTVTMGADSYTFAAYGDASCSNLLATASAFSKTDKPAAPTTPTAVATADKELSVSWQQPPLATKYHVTYTCNNGGSWGGVANGSVDSEGNLSQTGQTVTATADLSGGWWSGQSPACRMAVRAGNHNGWSSWVNSNSVTPP